MDFRRSTDENPEDNCDHYNQQQLRTFVKEQKGKAAVIAFDAQHEGVPHDEGMGMSDEKFNGLSKRLELAVGAPVLLTQNLAVEHGLVNGSQGKIADIVYCNGASPNHDTRALRMPSAVIVDFPEYKGPTFFSEAGKRTWVPLFPRTRQSEDDAAVSRTQYPLGVGVGAHTMEGAGHDAREGSDPGQRQRFYSGCAFHSINSRAPSGYAAVG